MSDQITWGQQVDRLVEGWLDALIEVTAVTITGTLSNGSEIEAVLRREGDTDE